MSQYLLLRHVYLCLTEDGVIFLDLKRDKYLGLGGVSIRALSTVVRGWPVVQGPQDSEIVSQQHATAIAELLSERGVLTRDLGAGKDAAPIAVKPVKAVLRDEEFGDRPFIRFGHVVKFVAACAVAASALRWCSLERTVLSVKTKKERYTTPSRSFDLRAAQELLTIFRRLRPFVFTAKNQCLFDSLALVQFLSRYDLYPTWVFGVRTGPFGAHCWVQEGDFVFNAALEHTREFTPILAI